MQRHQIIYKMDIIAREHWKWLTWKKWKEKLSLKRQQDILNLMRSWSFMENDDSVLNFMLYKEQNPVNFYVFQIVLKYFFSSIYSSFSLFLLLITSWLLEDSLFSQFAKRRGWHNNDQVFKTCFSVLILFNF